MSYVGKTMSDVKKTMSDIVFAAYKYVKNRELCNSSRKPVKC